MPSSPKTSKQYHVQRLLINRQEVALRASVSITSAGETPVAWEVTGYVAGFLNAPMLMSEAQVTVQTVLGPTIRGPAKIKGAPLPGARITVKSSGPFKLGK
jgi:hypothetical protein